MSTQAWVVIGAQLLLGSGLFILLLKLTFTLGQYTQRVEHLESALVEVKSILGELRHELTELRTTRQGRQQRTG